MVEEHSLGGLDKMGESLKRSSLLFYFNDVKGFIMQLDLESPSLNCNIFCFKLHQIFTQIIKMDQKLHIFPQIMKHRACNK
jgi:hypothetical protein